MTTDAGWHEETARMLVESLADGIYVTDLDRRIILWNQAAERITGYKANDIIGTTCFDDVLVHEDAGGNRMCGEDTCPLHRSMVAGEASRLPSMVFALCADGTRKPMEVSVAPLRAENGEIVGGVESFRDLSPLLKDLKRARAIQDLAMHGDLPDEDRLEFAWRSEPQSYVSGDFCRVEKIDDSRVVILLADVMGHGVSAALHTMQIRSLWEEARELLASPAAFLAHLDQKLAALTTREDFFATAFHGVIDITGKSLRYAIAGHPGPYLVRTGRALPLDGRGAALGLLGNAVYEEHEESLHAEDILLTYTDGAAEASNPTGRQLGQDGVADLFVLYADYELDEAIQNLHEEIVRFTKRVQLDDDLTLLAVRLK